MNRREFLLSTAIVPFLGAAWPTLATAAPQPQPLSIAQILAVAYPVVRREMFHEGWTWEDLNDMQRDGRLTFAPVGPTMEWFDGTRTPVQQMSVPLVWSKQEEIGNTEAGRIRLVRLLCENGINLHDFVFGEAIQGCRRCVVSQRYHHDLGEIVAFDDGAFWGTKLYTAFAVQR